MASNVNSAYTPSTASTKVEDLPNEIIVHSIKSGLSSIDFVCFALTARRFYALILSYVGIKRLSQIIPRQINYTHTDNDPCSYGSYSYCHDIALDLELEGRLDLLDNMLATGLFEPTAHQRLMIRLSEWVPREYVLCKVGKDTYVHEMKRDWACEKCEREASVPYAEIRRSPAKQEIEDKEREERGFEVVNGDEVGPRKYALKRR